MTIENEHFYRINSEILALDDLNEYLDDYFKKYDNIIANIKD